MTEGSVHEGNLFQEVHLIRRHSKILVIFQKLLGLRVSVVGGHDHKRDAAPIAPTSLLKCQNVLDVEIQVASLCGDLRGQSNLKQTAHQNKA
jgi:hypothetical protein